MGGSEDETAAENPVLLTLEGISNLNYATVLVLLQDFDGSDEEALKAALGRWRILKAEGQDVAYWQQSETGWKKKA